MKIDNYLAAINEIKEECAGYTDIKYALYGLRAVAAQDEELLDEDFPFLCELSDAILKDRAKAAAEKSHRHC